MEEEHRKLDYERLQGLESAHADLVVKFQRQQERIDSLSQQRGSQQLQQLADDPALYSTGPSMPRSSVGSAAPDDAMLGGYPVDDITENTNCELHVKMKNISMKVADGCAFTNPPRQPSIATRFQRAMLMSWLMRWWTHIRGYSLTFLEVTMSAH